MDSSFIIKETEIFDSSNLKIKVKTFFGEKLESLLIRLATCCGSESYPAQDAIEVWSSKPSLLKSIACDIDRLQKEFGVSVFEGRIWFRNANFSPDALEWNLSQDVDSFGSIMTNASSSLSIRVCDWKTKVENSGLRLFDVIGAPAKAFFLDHCWGDGSMRKFSGKSVLNGLTRMIEDLSWEQVWVDVTELVNETQFDKRIEQGIRNARAIIICLSHAYLSRKTCLTCFCLAVEDYFQKGKPLIFVSVEPNLSFSSISRWDPMKDMQISVKDDRDEHRYITVDRRTVAFVKNRLTGVFLDMAWSDGEGTWSSHRVSSTMNFLNSVKSAMINPLPRQSKPSLMVKEEHDLFYIEEDVSTSKVGSAAICTKLHFRFEI
jgi:hypothetical protein